MSENAPQPIITFYRVRIMLAQIAMVVVATMVMLALPVQIGAGVLAAIYCVMIWRRAASRRNQPSLFRAVVCQPSDTGVPDAVKNG